MHGCAIAAPYDTYALAMILSAAMTLDLFSVLFGGAVALLPIFAHLLGAGPQGLGVLRAAPAAGSLVTGIIVAHRRPMQRTGAALFAAVAANDFEVIQLGYNPSSTPAGLAGLTVNPGTVTGGKPATGTVSLTAAAPASGLAVSLSSSSASAVVPTATRREPRAFAASIFADSASSTS